jgi:hypothetical protein
LKIRLVMQSQSDDRKLASDDSHWSASAQNFVLPPSRRSGALARREGGTGQWKTEFSRRPFRTQSFGALFQPLRSWLISAVPSEQKSVFHPCSIPPSFHYGAAGRGR